jgi:hypothetical protein
MNKIRHHINADSSERSDLEKVKIRSTALSINDRICAMSDGSEPDSPLVADFIYKSCRISSLIFCKAFTEHIPLQKACTLPDLEKLCANMWRVKRSRWKEISGIFLFVILAAFRAAQNTPHERLLKTMMKTTCCYIGLDNFELMDAALMSYVKFQKWLRNESTDAVITA